MLIAGVVVLACSSPAHAAATGSPQFGVPIVLRVPSRNVAGSPAVAVASARVVAAWQQNFTRRAYGIAVRRGTTSGAFGAVVDLSVDGYAPAVAAGTGGGAAVIWLTSVGPRTHSVVVAVAPAHGRFGKPQTLARGNNIGSPEVLAAGGRYVAIWSRPIAAGLAMSYAVSYAVSDAAGRFGPARTFASDSFPVVSAGVAPDGTVTIALNGPALLPPKVSFARLAPGEASFGPVDPAVFPGGGAQVATGAGGSALTWTEGGLPQLLHTALLSIGNEPVAQTAFTITDSHEGMLYAAGPALALPAGGLAPVAAWALIDAPGGHGSVPATAKVLAAEPLADGTYGAPVELSTPGTIATNVGAAATTSTAVITWTTPAHPSYLYGLHYAVRSAGAFGPARSLTSDRAEQAAVLASSPGAVAAIWISHPGQSRRGVSIAILRDNA